MPVDRITLNLGYDERRKRYIDLAVDEAELADFADATSLRAFGDEAECREALLAIRDDLASSGDPDLVFHGKPEPILSKDGSQRVLGLAIYKRERFDVAGAVSHVKSLLGSKGERGRKRS